MANFLQISEPEAAALDAQSYTQSQAAGRARTASNALVQQYGPEAADPEMQQAAIAANTAQQTQPGVVAATNADNSDKVASIDREAQLRAAYALKSAMDSGVDGGTAWDTIVAPNASAWGIDPAHAAALRQHLSQDSKQLSSVSVDALISGLTGPAKPVGEPQLLRDASGNITSEMQANDRGGSRVINAPEGSTFLGPASLQGYAGAPQPVVLPDGSAGFQLFPKSGGSILIHADGTPVKVITAQTGQTNAKTAIYRAGTTAQNSTYGAAPGTSLPAAPGGAQGGGQRTINQAIIGQESGNNPNVGQSVDGAKGLGQITPGFWKTFAKPGESINNPADNLAVANRGIDYYMAQYHDPARAAVAYFSGPQNVAPPGSPTPWRKDAHDGNGTHTSTYVQQVLGRMQSAGAAPATAGQSSQAGGPAAFANLPPKGRQLALTSAQGIVNGSQQLASIDDQITNISKLVGPMSIGMGSMTAGIPGSPANNLHAALSTLRSQGLTAWLNSLKNASGSTGIGRVLQSEAAAAQNSFGALEQSQSEEQFRYHLGIFQSRIHQLQANAEQAFKQQYGTDPYSAMGLPAGATGGSNAHMSDSDLLSKYGVH